MDEPTYVDAGDEFGDLTAAKNRGRRKWQSPSGKWQRRILKAAHRKYYRTRDEQKVVNHIARQAVPMALDVEGWPEEWIEFCCQWCESKWNDKKPIKLWGLLNFIMDNDKKADWLSKNKGEVDMRPKSADEWRW